MSTIHQRRLKLATFGLGASAFECQLQSYKLDPGKEDGDRIYTFCPDGQDVTEKDDNPVVELKFFADYRSAGISDYLWLHDGETVAFSLHHHPDVAAEHVKWDGTVLIKAPAVGGEARETEMTEITLQIISPIPLSDGYVRV